jgi:hypothetical protein
MKNFNRKLRFLGLSLPALFIFAWATNVPVDVSEEDKEVFELLFGRVPQQESLRLADEIKIIKRYQSLIIDRFPNGTAVPKNKPREPKNLMDHGRGQCFDRARTIAKVLSWQGFKVRHVFVIFRRSAETGEVLTPLRSLVTKGNDSHAVVEVKTSAGWLVVDSNEKWISLSTRTRLPVPVDQIYARSAEFDSRPTWLQKNGPFAYLRGLYSRHGQFYPPFIPLPELNWRDFTFALF